MKIRDYNFKHICEIKPELLFNGVLKEYLPQSKYKNRKNLSLNKYGKGPFCKFKIPSNYTYNCVYIIRVENKIKYIGECINLSSRYNAGYGNISPRNCFIGGQETNCRLNNLIYKSSKKRNKISLWFFRTINYKKIERELIASEKPEWNKFK